MPNPVNILIVEHKLVKRMLNILKKKIELIRETNEVEPEFIDTVIDFFITFVEKFHHGKEEKVFYAELENKDLSTEHRKLLIKHVGEHNLATQKVLEMEKAKERYVEGDPNAFNDILEALEFFMKIYPPHLKVEDDSFFFQGMEYFTPEEREEMFKTFSEYDPNQMLKKYNDLADQIEEALDMK